MSVAVVLLRGRASPTDVFVFQRLGQFVTRFAPLVVLLWIVGVVLLFRPYRQFESVVVDGEFAYLPKDAPSRVAEELFDTSFGQSAVTTTDAERDIVGSSLVVVVRRQRDDLGEGDLAYIEEQLAPRIRAIAVTEGGLAAENEDVPEIDPAFVEYVREEVIPKVRRISAKQGTETHFVSPEDVPDNPSDEAKGPPRSVIARVRTPTDKSIGKLLVSADGNAALVVVELTTEFLEKRNRSTIKAIEVMLEDLSTDPDHRAEWNTVGLDTTISGLAVAGRDMRLAAETSAKKTEFWTVLLVVLLLVLIYRAPLLAIVPLLTVALSVIMALGTLSLLAGNGLLNLFTGVKVYIIVILYGAGVDYCLFLLARYKEELDDGASTADALANSVGRVGSALAASAGTTMCGIGMMYFADFGKFSQAGIAIPLSLFFVLLAAVTFTPALLRLCGSWAFWPHLATKPLPERAGWISPTSLVSRILGSNLFSRFWERMARWLSARPGTIWLSAVAIMLPFAITGIAYYDHLSYGLLSELPRDEPSVVGAEAVQEHFPAGTTGPVTVMLENPNIDFAEYREDEDVPGQLRVQPIKTEVGYEAIAELTETLEEHREELGIADIRSVSAPYGIDPANQPEEPKGIAGLAERKRRLQGEIAYYVSGAREHRGHLVRIDLVFQEDPFSPHSIQRFEELERKLPSMLPESLVGSTLSFVGATPSMRDLKVTTDGDQVRVDVIVSLAVFLILVLLLGERSPLLVAALVVVHFGWLSIADGMGLRFSAPAFWLADAVLLVAVIALRGRASAKSAYLMLSVLFSYFVTLGATIAVFYLADPASFVGLDWKVPMFLFTILVAVGQDYNIYLVTRVEEEQRRHGPVEGINVALARTGGIISSCGVIMAGTFSSLLAGSLTGMHQLGFALAFGVMLDTFVIRPILVPAYLFLLHSGRFGALGRYLGADDGDEYARESERSTMDSGVSPTLDSNVESSHG